jgi:hypothetical protein
MRVTCHLLNAWGTLKVRHRICQRVTGSGQDSAKQSSAPYRAPVPRFRCFWELN